VSAGFWPRPADVPRDLSAGFTVALVSIAEGLAYALVAGVDPVYGLYAGSVNALVGSLFASSTMLVVTATNALALVAADKIGALGDDVDRATALFTLTLLVGVVMAALGLARLGSLVRFVSPRRSRRAWSQPSPCSSSWGSTTSWSATPVTPP
jgi:sulfate permease, SulP family